MVRRKGNKRPVQIKVMSCHLSWRASSPPWMPPGRWTWPPWASTAPVDAHGGHVHRPGGIHGGDDALHDKWHDITLIWTGRLLPLRLTIAHRYLAFHHGKIAL